jgi:hypothetical protein
VWAKVRSAVSLYFSLFSIVLRIVFFIDTHCSCASGFSLARTMTCIVIGAHFPLQIDCILFLQCAEPDGTQCRGSAAASHAPGGAFGRADGFRPGRKAKKPAPCKSPVVYRAPYPDGLDCNSRERGDCPSGKSAFATIAATATRSSANRAQK